MHANDALKPYLFGRFIKWEDIKSARSKMGKLHISYSNYGYLDIPSLYFMKNKYDIYRAIDEYSPKDSPIRNIIKSYNHAAAPDAERR